MLTGVNGREKKGEKDSGEEKQKTTRPYVVFMSVIFGDLESR